MPACTGEQGSVKPAEEAGTAEQAVWRGYALALSAAGLWGLCATLAKSLFTASLPPLAVAQARSVVGFAVLWAILALFRRPLVRLPRREVGLAAATGLAMAVMHGTYYFAISRMPVAVAILIQDLAPLLILVYVRCFRRAKVSATVWMAAALCLAGCALVSGIRGGMGAVSAAGLAAGLLSAVAYGAYMLLAEEGGRRMSPWTLVCYALGFAILWWSVFRPWWQFPIHALSPHAAVLILFISVFGTLLPFGLVTLAMRRIPAGQAGITTTAEPVIAAVLAFLLLGEVLRPEQMVGGVLVLAGITLVQRAGMRRDG